MLHKYMWKNREGIKVSQDKRIVGCIRPLKIYWLIIILFCEKRTIIKLGNLLYIILYITLYINYI